MPDDADPTEWTRGEQRHERCRFGTFSAEAYAVASDGSGERPIVMPLCAWEFGEATPPAVARMWGGAIEFDRDCARCATFREIEPDQATSKAQDA